MKQLGLLQNHSVAESSQAPNERASEASWVEPIGACKSKVLLRTLLATCERYSWLCLNRRPDHTRVWASSTLVCVDLFTQPVSWQLPAPFSCFRAGLKAR
jgi:hypothetical protein